MIEVKTLIVGGGMAGLGAARTLQKSDDDDFLLITENVGGHVMTSADGETNYGAFYVRRDYKHMLPFVKREQKMRVRDMLFDERGAKRVIVTWQHLPRMVGVIRGAWLLHKYARRYRKFRARSEVIGPSQALREDKWLSELSQQPARQYLIDHGWEYWEKHFISRLVRATAFVDISQVSAAAMLTYLLPMVVTSWEFKLDLMKMVEPVVDRIREDVTVVSVARDENHWVVTDAAKKVYKCNNLILALPIVETKELLALTEPTNNQMPITVVHVRGSLKKGLAGFPFVFFSTESSDIWMTEEDGDTYLLYSTSQQPELSKYFDRFEVINTHHWESAMSIGSHITKIDRGDGLYMIGGHNFSNMEDAYISGIYAANRIIEG